MAKANAGGRNGKVRNVQEDLSRLTDEQVLKMLDDALAMTAEGILKSAMAVAELDRRGIRVSSLGMHMTNYLRNVAAGRLAPGVVRAIADKPSKVWCLARLPLPEQERIVQDGTVPVVVDGKETKVDLRELNPRFLPQVFAEDRVRTPEEQTAYIRAVKSREVQHRSRETLRRVAGDPVGKTIKIGTQSASVAVVAVAQAEAAGPIPDLDIEAAESDTATIRMTVAEKSAAKANAKRLGLTLEYYLRKTIHGAGGFARIKAS